MNSQELFPAAEVFIQLAFEPADIFLLTVAALDQARQTGRQALIFPRQVAQAFDQVDGLNRLLSERGPFRLQAAQRLVFRIYIHSHRRPGARLARPLIGGIELVLDPLAALAGSGKQIDHRLFQVLQGCLSRGAILGILAAFFELQNQAFERKLRFLAVSAAAIRITAPQQAPRLGHRRVFQRSDRDPGG